MPILPTALAAPVLASAAGYLAAKTGLKGDVETLWILTTSAIQIGRVFKKGRGNMFYNLEEHALSKRGTHPFLSIPPDLPEDPSGLTVEQAKAMECRDHSYREVYDTVLKYAQWLKERYGIQKDDIVALDCGNKPLFVFIWFAIWSLGARPAFINTSLKGDGLVHCVRTSSAKVLLVDEQLTDVLTDDVKQALEATGQAGVPAIVLDDRLQQEVVSLRGYRACDDCRGGIEPTTMALLIFTSGTTGLPKAAIVSWRRYYGSATSVATYIELARDDRFYTALPLYHSSASMLGLGAVLSKGATFVLSPHFSTRTYFASLVASHATTVQYIGEMCRYLLSTPPSPFDTAHSVRRFFGNGIRPDVWLPFKHRFAIPQIVEFYGATESPSSTFIKSRNDFGAGAIGLRGSLMALLSRNTSVLVRHDVETGEPLRDAATGLCVRAGTDEAGELLAWVDPDDVGDKFAGYWGNEKASSGKILRDVLRKGDAYFRTGDLLRTDREGRTFFVDRVGDTFRWKGENVSTGEVEKVLAAHPLLQEVNVYGVQLPSHDGRAGCAAVVFAASHHHHHHHHRDDDTRPTRADLDDLARHVVARLPRFAAPLFLRSVPALEKTGTAKYQKHGLRVQGVDPAKVGPTGDTLYWLDPRRGGGGGSSSLSYTEFGEKDWRAIVGGKVRL